jgi:CheY-like chemotaxis protein
MTSAHEPAQPSSAPQPMAPHPAPPAPADGAPRRLDILVVEDDAVNRLLIGGFLRRHGHTVSFAQDGEQGVAQARARRHDVVLMDVVMPGIDGPAATRLIRALPPPLGEVPIIALTANAMQGDRERYLADGMSDYVTKPIDRGALFAAIERAVGGRAFGAEAVPAPNVIASDGKQAAMLDALTESLDL